MGKTLDKLENSNWDPDPENDDLSVDLDVAYVEGWGYRESGWGDDECPYPRESEAAAAWYNGLHDYREDRKDVLT